MTAPTQPRRLEDKMPGGPGPTPRDRRAWLQCLAIYALLGAACGLDLWSDWLTAPLLLLTLIVLLAARPREVLSWSGGVLVLAFVLAAWPFLQFNFAHNFGSVQQLFYFSGTSNSTLLSRLAGLPVGIGSAAALALPALYGSPAVCGQESGSWCSLLNVALSAGVLAIFGVAALPVAEAILMYVRRLRQGPRGAFLSPQGWQAAAARWRQLDRPLGRTVARTQARLWVVGMLLAYALVMFAALVLSPLNLVNPLEKTRYLTPLYLCTPLLFGALWDTARPGLNYLFRLLREKTMDSKALDSAYLVIAWIRSPRSKASQALAAVICLVVLLAFSAVDGASVLTTSAQGSIYGVPEAPADAQILAFFDAHNVRTFYSDTYYDCYTFAFESSERQVCAVLDPSGGPAPQSWINRYAPYVRAVARDPHPAYLLRASADEESKVIQGNLQGQGYVRTVVDGYVIYYYRGTT